MRVLCELVSAAFYVSLPGRVGDRSDPAITSLLLGIRLRGGAGGHCAIMLLRGEMPENRVPGRPRGMLFRPAPEESAAGEG